jgi:DNA-binding MarR family transcriptional regulator
VTSSSDRKPRADRATEAVRALSRLSRVLETASPQLSLAHYRVLSAVASGDERATRIASRLALGKPSVSSAVEALAARGLIVRSEVADDQRATCLGLTDDGRTLLAEVEAAMSARLRAVAERTASPVALLDALVAIQPALDSIVAEREAGTKR